MIISQVKIVTLRLLLDPWTIQKFSILKMHASHKKGVRMALITIIVHKGFAKCLLHNKIVKELQRMLLKQILY